MGLVRNLTTFRWLHDETRGRQEAALRRIENLGAQLEIENDSRGAPFVVVTWNGADEGLDQLGAVAHLRWLDLSRTNVTDDGLAQVRQLEQLQVLKLQQTRVSDEGLANLSGLAELEGLALHDTKTSAAGLEHLRPLVNLR
jgi:hypothetical protein